jgi:hypothetical protein
MRSQGMRSQGAGSQGNGLVDSAASRDLSGRGRPLGRCSDALRLVIVGISLVLPATTTALATDLTGCWAGSWESCTSGHAGPLHATFTRCGETEYRVTFTGRFLKVIPFRYSVTLTVVEDRGDELVLAGTSYLGRLFGTFSYRATATDGRFTADYTSKKDDGTFRMTRSSR